MLAEKDVLKGLSSIGPNAAVREVMQQDFAFTMSDEPLHNVQNEMKLKRVSSLPVVNNNGELYGLLTINDINEAYRMMAASPNLALGAK